jgi:hypothetical protein
VGRVSCSSSGYAERRSTASAAARTGNHTSMEGATLASEVFLVDGCLSLKRALDPSPRLE